MKENLKKKMEEKGFSIGYELAEKMSKENPEQFNRLAELFSKLISKGAK